MTSFKALYKLAAASRGGAELLEAALPKAKTPDQLAAQPDDRYLSMMARCVFRAGFVWRAIDTKWPGFETAFASLRAAVAMEDALPYDEPWGVMQPCRHALGALLLEQGCAVEAESVYVDPRRV